MGKRQSIPLIMAEVDVSSRQLCKLYIKKPTNLQSLHTYAHSHIYRCMHVCIKMCKHISECICKFRILKIPNDNAKNTMLLKESYRNYQRESDHLLV